jgi:hypothetical protein
MAKIPSVDLETLRAGVVAVNSMAAALFVAGSSPVST